MAYLRSIFPGEFAPGRLAAQGAQARLDPARVLPRWSRIDPALGAAELATLFDGSWQFLAHRAQFAAAGDFVAVDAGTERVVAILDEGGRLRALRDACPEAPHRLSPGAAGRLPGHFDCRSHGLRFGFDGGRLADAARPGMLALDSVDVGGLLFVRAGVRGAGSATAHAWSPALLRDFFEPALEVEPPLVSETPVGADWKVLVECWLAAGLPDSDLEAAVWTGSVLEILEPVPVMRWSASLRDAANAWSVGRYRTRRPQCCAERRQHPRRLAAPVPATQPAVRVPARRSLHSPGPSRGAGPRPTAQARFRGRAVITARARTGLPRAPDSAGSRRRVERRTGIDPRGHRAVRLRLSGRRVRRACAAGIPCVAAQLRPGTARGPAIDVARAPVTRHDSSILSAHPHERWREHCA
jgi:nitrite reductase/ring-hydroxylating ferredoxin subunit